MGDKTSGNDPAAERKLRGDALMGSERRAAADHAEYEKTRTPDSELHLDGEEDTLGSDGLDIGDASETLFGTRGKSRGIIKP